MDQYQCDNCHQWRDEEEMDTVTPTICRYCAQALEHQTENYEPMVRWLYGGTDDE